MIQIERVLRITHAVHDQPAAEAFYQDLLGARRFFEGFLESEQRRASLYVIGNLCIEPVSSSDPTSRVGRFLESNGQGLFSVLFAVKDLDQAAEHLASHGVRFIRPSRSCLAADPRDTLGTPMEFTDVPLPHDPRLVAGWSTDYWRDEHPMGIALVWSIMTLVPETEPALDFSTRVLGVRVLYTASGTVASKTMTFVMAGSSVVGLMEPRKTPSDLTKVVERQGTEGLHSISMRMKSIPDTVKYLRSKGIGVIGRPAAYTMPHPRMCFGARFMLGHMPKPGDTHWKDSQDIGGV